MGGLEFNDKLRIQFYSTADVFVIIYSIASPSSFTNVIAQWFPELNKHCPNTPIILVGLDPQLRIDATTILALSEKGLAPVSKESAINLKQQIQAAAYLECNLEDRKELDNVIAEAVKARIIRSRIPSSPAPSPTGVFGKRGVFRKSFMHKEKEEPTPVPTIPVSRLF